MAVGAQVFSFGAYQARFLIWAASPKLGSRATVTDAGWSADKISESRGSALEVIVRQILKAIPIKITNLNNNSNYHHQYIQKNKNDNNHNHNDNNNGNSTQRCYATAWS